MLKEEAIKKEEVVKKECLKNDHKGFDIVAVDLSYEYNQENDQKKYYCVKCLIEKLGIKKIILFEEAIKKSEITSQQLKKNKEEKYQQTTDCIQKLQGVIKSIQGSVLKQLEDVNIQLEIQIINEQKKQEKIPEPTTTNDAIKLLSSCYQEDGRLASPSPIMDNKEITDFLIQIKKLLKQFASFEQFQDIDKEILKIEQTCQINLQVDEKQKKTPSLNILCDNHKMEIIMFNLNQTEFEQTNPFLCVECAQDLLTKGNTISLRKAEDKWNEYIKDQSEKISQRQTRLDQAIGIIKRLQEKYNQEFNKMIQSLNDQLKKQPKEYEELMKLKNTRLQHQDKQSLLEIIKILGQTEQSKNREQISNQEDSEFYQSQKKVLEELIKENLLVENQIQWLQNFDQQPRRSNDSENDQELVDFLKKSTIQDLYLSFFEISFNSLISFKKEEQDLKQKGKLQKLQLTDQENQNEAISNQQKWYKQFLENQAKLDRFKKVDELQTSQGQLDELLLQEQENKQKMKELELVTENQKKQLQQAQIKFENINQLSENIKELKQIYKIGESKFVKGETELLSQEYAQKLYKYIEQRTNRQIKNKYLMYSSKNSGLNSNTFVNSIDKMSNLLMVFKSKAQYIFGGYSPCQWLKCSTNYQADETLSSFLFSQTQGDIYPLNPTNSDSAIIMNNSEIGFGNYDMRIDYLYFQNGSSNLGSAYKIPTSSKKNIFSVQNVLFGSPQPNIVECEVIMLTFV